MTPHRKARQAILLLPRALAAAGLVLLLAGCDEQALYSKLSERQANEMVAALRMAGIPAEKVARETDFAVTTSGAQFAQAVHTLNAMGLPREQFDTLGQVFKREGFVSSPLEERSRLIHAMSQELSHTVSSIDGVLLARVNLVVPEKHPLADKVVPSSASVLIKHRPGMDMDTLVPKIKALMVNSVEGLPYDSVTVVPFVAEAWTAPPLPNAPAAPALLAPLLASGALGLVALAAAGGLWWWRRRVKNRPGPHGVPAELHSVAAGGAAQG